MKWKNFRHRIILLVVSTVGAWIIRALLASLRMTVIGDENLRAVREPGKGAIFVFWHSRILYMLAAQGKQWRVHTMVSRNRDGEYIARLAQKFDRPTVRGSSSRGGGKAFMTLCRVLNSGDSVAFTPDGPRGPKEVFQPGAARLALMTGRPMVPVAYSVRQKKVFASWDNFVLPYPFTKGVFLVGEPIWPESFKNDKEGLRALCQECENQLRAITRKADRLVENKQSEC